MLDLHMTSLNKNMQQLQEYCLDYMQRSVIFMDVLRRRGNEMLDMTKNNSSTVLNFDFEIIMNGAEFNLPINYWLAKVKAPNGVKTDPMKRAYVIQDPRAGQGPGIGGFKKDSEIGDALRNGHPVYFIGFNAHPIEGQTYEDVIKGQLKFYEKIAQLHPKSPKMCAIGNCAAGYLSMFSAMQRPDIFGPILIAGSPLSYWNGERGKNPMRYAGGLIGGSWINSFLGDLGGGKFDGTYLILNFDWLNPENFLWSKQYNLFSNIDQDAERYLQFEKWWGDFILFNTTEIKWLVDKLFIGNQLTTGQLTTSDGVRLDLREITSPIVTFVSDGDNISPPAQSAGWIADIYKDVDEIIARGKTVVYCLNHKVGHLAIFTATKVGRREDEVFIENMDTIDVLPPGLYELIIDTPEGDEKSGHLVSHYEPRTIDDIKALGWNTEVDDRAFATVAKASEAFSYLYDKMYHPLFKLFADPIRADRLKNFRPLRLSYSLFADKINPWLKLLEPLAAKAATSRKTVAADNLFLHLQDQTAKLLSEYLINYTQLRDACNEFAFFNLWSNPWIQRFWETYDTVARYTPSQTQLDREALNKQYQQQIIKNMPVNNLAEGLLRFVGLAQAKNHFLGEFLVRVLSEEARLHDASWDDKVVRQAIKAAAMGIRHDTKQALHELAVFAKNQDNALKLHQLVQNIYLKAHKEYGYVAPNGIAQSINEIAHALKLKPIFPLPSLNKK